MSFTAAAIPIANSALTLVGTRLISSIADASKECTLIKTNWDTYRRAILRDGLWKFAKQIVVLQPDQNYQRVFGYQQRYPLPTDFIRLVEFNGQSANIDSPEAPWRVMTGFIYANMSYANLVYICDVTDVTQYDPLFCEAFAAYIAAKLCNTLTGSPNSAAALEQAYKVALQKARFAGSTEDPSVPLDADIWLQSRFGGPSLFRDPPFVQESTPDFP